MEHLADLETKVLLVHLEIAAQLGRPVSQDNKDLRDNLAFQDHQALLDLLVMPDRLEVSQVHLDLLVFQDHLGHLVLQGLAEIKVR